MIDLTFEKYSECKLENFKIVDSYRVQQWIHFIVSFRGDVPAELVEPEALVITGESGSVLQVILREEGCDSPLFQFTDNEKKQIIEWFKQQDQ
ncbi:hypothetical protein [Halalkalibacter akibai]|uniref:Uncharacterized protein n=1 Tax=Halalkalibacter akibai (strain ATCC 43226 / DSM 21942 / CIP 109018 / JCM 9157 / 1139) TaxID=1236973 RepID=W4QWL5_HALA3|nr:hypothetical protein [Halalkalibacter akibai]GAE36515.1 hypothetical protein JCM9157_3708 [Halalkalibacter akibai JCM 9157]